MNYQYKPRGVCSRLIAFQIVDGIIQEVVFTDGCNGNLQGISVLVQGMPAALAIEKLKGISCNGRNTSCPDQLAEAIARAIAENPKEP